MNKQLETALNHLADLIPNGHLMASVDAAAFLDAVAREIKELRRLGFKLARLVGCIDPDETGASCENTKADPSNLCTSCKLMAMSRRGQPSEPKTASPRTDDTQTGDMP